MKKTAGSRTTGVNLGLIITPMLDMSFQILAFFIMTYHPSALEGHLAGTLAAPPDNPGHGGIDRDAPILDPGELNDSALTVVVKSAGEAPGKPGKILLRRKVEPVPAQIADATVTWVQARRLLQIELKRLGDGVDKTSIRIEADAELRHEIVIDVYDVCRNAGFSRILFVPPPR
jgi:biopolymer transport protein ExbD